MKAKPFVLAATLAMVLATQGATEASDYRRIRDVNVTCTNGLSCDLSLIGPAEQIYSVALRREAGPHAPVSLVVDTQLRLLPGSQIAFLIDGTEIASLPVGDFSYRAAMSEYTYSGSETIGSLIEAARSGRQLVLQYQSRNGAGRSVFSMSGFPAGLAFMDEVQGRAGKSDALQTKGSAPPADRPAVEDIDAMTDIPAPIRGEFSDAARDCGILEPERIGVYGGFSVRLDEARTFYAIPCGAGGAYNQPFRLYLGTGGDYAPVGLPAMAEAGPTVADLAWNVVWDDGDKVLTGRFLGRGVGDCGTYMRWSFDPSIADDLTGPGFVLLEHRVKDECDGDDLGGPQNWPALWPK